jgi:hypothetical protein
MAALPALTGHENKARGLIAVVECHGKAVRNDLPFVLR